MAVSLGMILGALSLCFLAGCALFVRGMRGRRVDDHRLCRKCGFDLFGLPDGVTKCSECGADVSSPAAVRIGHRRRSRRLIVAGLLLLVPVLVTSGILIVGTLAQVEWIRYEPFWYVHRQVDSNVAADRKAAVAEISRRISAGLLSEAQVATIVDQGLAIQADLNKTWDPQWGDWIEAARAAGNVSDENWKQYLANAPVLKLVARSEVRRGENLPIRIELLPSRVGRWSRPWLNLSYTVQPSDLALSSSSGGPAHRLTPTGFGTWSRQIRLDPKLVAAAPVGPRTLHVRVKLELSQSSGEQSPPVIVRELDLKAPWNLVSADARTATPIDDESLRAGVEQSIEAHAIGLFTQRRTAQLNLTLQSPPIPLAYKVVLRSGDREWPLGAISLPAGQGTTWSLGTQVEDFDVEKADVILRPDLQTVMDSVDLHEYWNGEVVIKDVQVKRLQ